MTLWIRLLAWSRLPLAAAVAIMWVFGWFEVGAWLFAIGLLTKALDTPLSVWQKCPIPADDELYRLVAAIFNAAAVVGLTAGFCNLRSSSIAAILPILPLAITAAIMAITRLFVKPHSVIAKARSEFISCVVVAFAAPMVPLYLSFISLGIIGLGNSFKVLYYADNKTKK